jgi:peptidyl-prolyl cis-trans isomerase C
MKINDVEIDASAWPTPELAAVHELLRQRASELGFLGNEANSTDIEQAIERTLAEEVPVPEPTDEECARWFDANKQRFRSGDLVCARHILFQITPGSPVPAIRGVAESMLHELQNNPQLFGERAKEHSNCPSGAQGGNLGQLQRGETVPEFDKALFGDATTIGILPKLVTTRHGFHIISIDQRIEGKQLPYDFVRDDVAAELRRRSEARALSQYVRLLAGNAELEGVDLDAAASPLVQ